MSQAFHYGDRFQGGETCQTSIPLHTNITFKRQPKGNCYEIVQHPIQMRLLPIGIWKDFKSFQLYWGYPGKQY